MLFSASDPDGGIPSLLIDNMPNNSSFTDNGDGTYTFSDGTYAYTSDFTTQTVRLGELELAGERGISLTDATMEVMDDLWEELKKAGS